MRMNQGTKKIVLATVAAIVTVIVAVAFPKNDGAKVYAANNTRVALTYTDAGIDPVESFVEVEEGGNIEFVVTNTRADHTISYGGVSITTGNTGTWTYGPVTSTGDFDLFFTVTGPAPTGTCISYHVTKLLPSSGAGADDGVGVHECVFEWVTTNEPTEEQDGEEALRCKICGKTIQYDWLSGASVLINRIVRDIRKAAPGGTVMVDTRYLTCYPQIIFDELAKRPDVTLVTNYVYEHKNYTMTIPAGKANTPGVVDEKGYAGFRRIAQYFPTTER